MITDFDGDFSDDEQEAKNIKHLVLHFQIDQLLILPESPLEKKE